METLFVYPFVYLAQRGLSLRWQTCGTCGDVTRHSIRTPSPVECVAPSRSPAPPRSGYSQSSVLAIASAVILVTSCTYVYVHSLPQPRLNPADEAACYPTKGKGLPLTRFSGVIGKFILKRSCVPGVKARKRQSIGLPTAYRSALGHERLRGAFLLLAFLPPLFPVAQAER